jgi:hypothetical protein
MVGHNALGVPTQNQPEISAVINQITNQQSKIDNPINNQRSQNLQSSTAW